MFLKFSLFTIFSGFCLTSAVFVVLTKNPIFSVLFLIFSFFNVVSFLFLFNFEFLPLTFIVVYVGAVAVLFLFVIMMLNIKLAEFIETYQNLLPVAFIFSIVFFYQLTFLMRFDFEVIGCLNKNSVSFLLDFLNTSASKYEFVMLNGLSTNIKMVAFAFFNNFLFHFLLSGVVLLLAMVGAILLTLQKKFVTKNQNVYNQILKDFNHTIVTTSKLIV